MKLKIMMNGRGYTAELNDNVTAQDIAGMLPLEMNLRRYAEHEYYCPLTKKPSIKDAPMTSDAHAQGIYYYDGWSAFTILFGDAHIAPFKVVHIGDIAEDVSYLASAGDMVKTSIEIQENLL